MVAELARVTVTWGRAAPEGSVTAPAKAPVVADWQWEGEGEATARRVRMRVATNSLRRGGGIGKRIVTRHHPRVIPAVSSATRIRWSAGARRRCPARAQTSCRWDGFRPANPAPGGLGL